MGQHDDLMAAALEAVTAIEMQKDTQPSADYSGKNFLDAVKAVDDISTTGNDFDLAISITSFDDMLNEAILETNPDVQALPEVGAPSNQSEKSIDLESVATEINPAVVRPTFSTFRNSASNVRPPEVSVKLQSPGSAGNIASAGNSQNSEPVSYKEQNNQNERMSQNVQLASNHSDVEVSDKAPVLDDEASKADSSQYSVSSESVSGADVAASESNAGGQSASVSTDTDDDDLSLSADLKNKLDEMTQAYEETYRRALELHDENEQLKAIQIQLNDRLARMKAESDNYRKRVMRDQEQSKNQAEERIVLSFLPVMDNLSRAIFHAKQSQDYQKLLQGVEMTGKLYLGVLAKHGCVPFDSMGAEFDPVYHDVLQRVIDSDKPHNTIVQEHLKGYKMHDRVVRPALVVVAQHEGEND